MKKVKHINVVFLFFVVTFSSNAQKADINVGKNTAYVMFTPKIGDDNSEFAKITHKMYFSEVYSPAKISNLDGVFHLRYNIFKDEMEFTKEGEVFYLTKVSGRKIVFTALNISYTIFDVNGKLQYFLVNNKGQNTLLTKMIVKFVEAKPALSSYEPAKPADFKRKKDEYYIAMNNKDLIEIPQKKKEFYPIFGSKSSNIKSYIKGNKLRFKDIEDLKKIINYFNTL